MVGKEFWEVGMGMAMAPSYIDSRPFCPGGFRFPNWQPHREMLRNSQATQAEEHKGVNSTIARLKEDNECTKRNYEEQVGVPRWSCSPRGGSLLKLLSWMYFRPDGWLATLLVWTCS